MKNGQLSIASNHFNQGRTGRCCQEISMMSSTQGNLIRSDSNWYAGAKCLELSLPGRSPEIFGSDVYYLAFCYLCFMKAKNSRH